MLIDLSIKIEDRGHEGWHMRMMSIYGVLVNAGSSLITMKLNAIMQCSHSKEITFDLNFFNIHVCTLNPNFSFS